MAKLRIAAHRTFMGWDLFHEPIHNGMNWTARKDDGSKYRADTLAGLKSAIRSEKGSPAYA